MYIYEVDWGGDSLVGPEHFVGDLAEEDLLLGPQAGRRRLSLEGLSVEQRHRFTSLAEPTHTHTTHQSFNVLSR